MRIDYQNAILLVLCLVLLLSVFTLSASAADQFLPILSNPYPDGFRYARYYENQSRQWYELGSADVESVVVGIRQSDPSVMYVGVFSNVPGHIYYNTSQNFGLYPFDLEPYNDMYFNYLPAFPKNSRYTYYIDNVFDTMEEAYNYAKTLLPPVTSFQYSLPPGNVAYIPIPSGQSSAITYTLTTTYYMAFGNNDTSRINQVVTVMSSLPSSTNNVAPSSPKIPWTNNGNVNLLGVSANKIYQGSIPANYGGQYLVVVNPMTMPSQTGLIGGDTYTNGSINISVSAVSGSPHIYPMSESLTITPGDGIGSESSYGDSGYTYEIDPETGEIIWTDPEGGSSAPVAGGNNPMPSPNTIFDWLRNISQQFSDFLRGPVQAVQVVVSAIRDFLGSFTQLYQWLPGPVYSLITSALMIALTIGVIKIFV